MLIIRNLPLHLANSAIAWLEHLLGRMIHGWTDLVRIFAGNFQGTYVRPGNSWDLRSCRQKSDESLRDFIRRFSKQCTELLNITDSDIIGAFIAGTTSKELVHELGRKTPTSTSQLLDIATNFASGEEAVGAIFSDGARGKQKAETTEASGSRDPKKKKRGRKGKQGQSDDNLVVAADLKNPKRAPAGPGLFDEMLKPCPYHKGPTKHTLEECTVLRRYYTNIIAKEGAEEPPKGNDAEGEGFPKVKNCLLIFGGARLASPRVKESASSERSARLTRPRPHTLSGPRAPLCLIDRITRIGSRIPGVIHSSSTPSSPIPASPRC